MKHVSVKGFSDPYSTAQTPPARAPSTFDPSGGTGNMTGNISDIVMGISTLGYALVALEAALGHPRSPGTSKTFNASTCLS
jgi:hypothetical protein